MKLNEHTLGSFEERKKTAMTLKAFIHTSINQSSPEDPNSRSRIKKGTISKSTRSLIEIKEDAEFENVSNFDNLDKEQRNEVLFGQNLNIRQYLNDIIKYKNKENIEVDKLEENISQIANLPSPRKKTQNIINLNDNQNFRRSSHNLFKTTIINKSLKEFRRLSQITNKSSIDVDKSLLDNTSNKGDSKRFGSTLLIKSSIKNKLNSNTLIPQVSSQDIARVSLSIYDSTLEQEMKSKLEPLIENKLPLNQLPLIKQLSLKDIKDYKSPQLPLKNLPEPESNINRSDNITQVTFVSTEGKLLSTQLEPQGNLNHRTKTQMINVLKEENFRKLTKKEMVYDSLSDDEENVPDYSWIIHPTSKFMGIWQMIILFIILYSITYVPFNISFFNENTLAILIVDLLCDSVFIVDIVLQFFIPYQEDVDEYVLSLRQIANKYLTSWFAIDLISCIPFNTYLDVVYTFEDFNNEVVQSNQILLLLRLIRLTKLIKISNQYEIKQRVRLNIFKRFHLSPTLKRLLEFMVYFLILNHMLACIWSFIGKLDTPNWIENANMKDAHIADLYIAALYFNLATIFTVGYGDIVPINNYEIGYNILIQIVGVFLYSFAISNIVNIVQVSPREHVYNTNLHLLENIRIQYEVNNKLYSKIKRYLHYHYVSNTNNKFNLLKDVPNPLRSQLICSMYKDIISQFKFFKNTNADFNAKVLLVMNPHKATYGEMLIKSGDHVEELIFIKRGILSIEKIYKHKLIKISQIRKGEHFGEVCMILHKRCKFDIVVKSKSCEVYFVNQVDLIHICAEYPDIFELIAKRSDVNLMLFEQKYEERKRNLDQETKRQSIHKILTETPENKIYFDKEIDFVDPLPVEDRFGNKNTKGDWKIEIVEETEESMSSDFSIKDSHNASSNIRNASDESKVSPTLSKRNTEDKYVRENAQVINSKEKASLDFSSSQDNREFPIKNTLPNITNINRPIPEKDSVRSSIIKGSSQIPKVSSKLDLNYKPNLLNSSFGSSKSKKKPSTVISPSLELKQYQSTKNVDDTLFKKGNWQMKKPTKRFSEIQLINLNAKRHSIMMNKNIRESSMNLNEPSVFYTNLFEKYKYEQQIRRMDRILTKLHEKYLYS